MTLPNFPSVSPNPEISWDYAGDLSLTLSPTAADGLDAYSISRLYNPTPTNEWVVTYRIPAVNSPADGYITGNIFVMPSSQLPPAGSTYSYYIYAFRFAAGGGAAQYYYSSTFSITRTAQPSSYGMEIYNSSGILVIGADDIAALYKASYSGSVSTISGQKTLTVDISAPGVLTSDIVFIEELELDEVQSVSIPTNGTIRYQSTITSDPTPSSWTSIYKITVISKGDT